MPGDFDFFNDEPAARPAPPARERAPADDDRPAPRTRPIRRPPDDPDEGERPYPRSREPAAKKRMSPLVIVGIAVGALVVLIGGVVAIILVATGGSKSTEPKDKSGTPAATTSPKPAPLARKEVLDPNLPSPEVVDRVKKATLRVLVAFRDGKSASGSGFVEKDTRLVLTNAHVVGVKKPADPWPRAINLVVNSGEGEREYRLRGELMAVDTENDLAVIRPGLLEVGERHVVPDGLVVPRTSNLSLLQKLFVFGFPLGSEIGKEITVSDVSVTSLRKDETGRLNKIQVKGGMTHGNSGGPVVDVKGNVIGVAVSGIKETDINFCVPGEMVQQLLAKRKEWKD
jgi:S1-C subfamily serine protease